MKSLRLFLEYAPYKTFLAVFLGAISGGCYALLIPIVIAALSDSENVPGVVYGLISNVGGEGDVASSYAIVFFSLCIIILISKSASEILLSKISLAIRLNLRKDFYQRVVDSPLSYLEKVGHSRLIQALSTDVSLIVNGAQIFPSILTNTVTLVGLMAYLAYIDYSIFAFVLFVTIVGVLTYQIPIMIASRYFSQAREYYDVLQEGLRGLVDGIKELKLNTPKQEKYTKEILYEQEDQLRAMEFKGFKLFCLTENYGQLLCFLTIGVLSFLFFDQVFSSPAEAIAAVMVLLYVSGPIGSLLGFIPQLSRTDISLRKMDDLYKNLDDENLERSISDDLAWQEMRLSNLVYTYEPEDQNGTPFSLGPIDLSLKRGEITIIAGGNGSGKSTLGKVLSLLYFPDEGKILFDGCEIDQKNTVAYRQKICSVFSDFHLFDRVFNMESLSEDYQRKFDYYLKAFNLHEKVKITDGRFSTLKLSDGQRKRLALIVAILEDCELMIFDEWAADQDPEFKQIFYYDILPFLKSRNKAVVAISHDDRYFETADQLVRMEYGKFTEVAGEEKSISEELKLIDSL